MNNHHYEEHTHHVTPVKVYVKTFAGLIFLTILTVATSYFDFGIMNLAVALAIATAKATLVILFFMQLKYEGIENKITFYSSFFFLAIFLCLTGADFLFRQDVQPLRIEQMAGAGGGETDINKLRVATPALVEQGKTLFAQQCTACHGTGGAGDGPAAAALNPKPRNFQSGYWRYGGAPSMIFHTISTGSPGTAMAAFTTLSVEQRYALAHYVHSISKPTPPEDSAADIEAAKKVAGGGGAAGGAAKEIPIDVAMENMEVPDQVVVPVANAKNPSHPGAYLYRAQCAQCHGLGGEGAKVQTMGVNPVVVLTTRSFAETASAPWMQSEAAFIKMVSEGIPGRGMPGMSDYSASEWSNLYSYVKGLTVK